MAAPMAICGETAAVERGGEGMGSAGVGEGGEGRGSPLSGIPLSRAWASPPALHGPHLRRRFERAKTKGVDPTAASSRLPHLICLISAGRRRRRGRARCRRRDSRRRRCRGRCVPPFAREGAEPRRGTPVPHVRVSCGPPGAWPTRKTDSEGRLGRPTRKTNSDDRLGRPTRKTDSDDRLGRPTRKTDSDDRLGRPTRKADSEG